MIGTIDGVCPIHKQSFFIDQDSPFLRSEAYKLDCVWFNYALIAIAASHAHSLIKPSVNMEPTPVYDLPDKAVEPVAPPPTKRPRLSREEPVSVSMPTATLPTLPDSSHDASEALRGPKLTRAEVDYWRWKYEEVTQYASALMPPGLLSLAPVAPGQFPPQPPAAWEPQLDSNADWELAYEINMEMGLVLGGSSQRGREARNSRSDVHAGSFESTPSSLPGTECGGQGQTTPASEVGINADEGNLQADFERLRDLGLSLQRQAREQLDLIQMPPPQKGM